MFLRINYSQPVFLYQDTHIQDVLLVGCEGQPSHVHTVSCLAVVVVAAAATHPPSSHVSHTAAYTTHIAPHAAPVAAHTPTSAATKTSSKAATTEVVIAVIEDACSNNSQPVSAWIEEKESRLFN